jgi:hypothetical protein
VLRHLAVRADLELKRAAKSAVRQREKAAKRPPRPPAPMAPAAAPASAEIPPPAEKGEPS